jgi:hypothetical protein
VGPQCPTPLAAIAALVKVFASDQPMLSNSADSHNDRRTCTDKNGYGLVRTRAERCELALDLGERARELLAPCGVCRSLQLTAELGKGQTERFCAPQLLGIAIALWQCASRPLFFPLIHPLLYAVLCVDESFT